MGQEIRVGGLTGRQRRFLRKFGREVKPIREMLRECRVGVARFAEWRGEEAFARAYRRVVAGMTRDTLAELRVAFAVCGRLISEEVFAVEGEIRKKADEVKQAEKGEERTGADAGDGTEEKPKRKRGKRGGGVRKAGLKGPGYRLCFDVVKLGTAVFVPRRAPVKARRAFPKVDMEALAGLEEARRGGRGEGGDPQINAD